MVWYTKMCGTHFNSFIMDEGKKTHSWIFFGLHQISDFGGSFSWIMHHKLKSTSFKMKFLFFWFSFLWVFLVKTFYQLLPLHRILLVERLWTAMEKHNGTLGHINHDKSKQKKQVHVFIFYCQYVDENNIWHDGCRWDEPTIKIWTKGKCLSRISSFCHTYGSFIFLKMKESYVFK